jgi:hypothetical protein
MFCWVYGEDVHSYFEINISRVQTVGALKRVIKSKKPNRFRNVDANNLDLYSIPFPDPAHIQDTLKQWTLKNKLCLDPRDLLSDLMADSFIIIHGPILVCIHSCTLLSF